MKTDKATGRWFFWACRRCWNDNSGYDPTKLMTPSGIRKFRPVAHHRTRVATCYFCKERVTGVIGAFRYEEVDEED